ncbi:MAG: hypothetical protein ACXVB9_19865 [Bdellovibrionota bacterium]
MRLATGILFAFTLIAFSSCTKGREVPKSADGKPMLSPQADPNRVIFETDLDVPKEFKSRIKRTDLMIWDIKTNDGDVVTAQIVPVPDFPSHLVITSAQLFQPLPEGAHVMFAARIVKFGDEGKPPMKGQLQVFVGTEPDQHELVVSKSVNQKLLDKFMKKLKIVTAEDITVGAKAKAQFAPALM